MSRRLRFALAVAAVSSTALTVTIHDAASAPPSPTARFHAVAHQHVDSRNVQAFSNKPVTVMVQVAGDSITEAKAKAGGKLSAATQSHIRANLQARQAGVADGVKSVGGKVQAEFQNAYNGLRVTVPQRSLTKLESLPNVVGVHAITPKKIDNVHGVPLIGAPGVWDGVNGLAGEGIKIAIIDTGLDYTHADFGGPGTPAAYTTAHASETAAANPAQFGPAAPRVKGGYDFVGDSYNADPQDPAYQPVPHPDPNPLDCNGHGTHVAGTAAGSGVLSNGSTFTGPYNASTVSSNSWNVGPGVAPKADLYALRVFGCEGSTDVVADAIEWAVNNGMNVINMSLGSTYGGPDDPDAVAVNNAAAAGVIVAVSSGNEGPNPYMTGTPGTADGSISSAASDPTQQFPAANVALSTGPTLQAIDANGTPVSGLNAPVKVLYTGLPHDAAHISLGCDPSEYTAAGVTGDIVIVKRGTCARVARAIFGQQAGAAAVIMVNSSNSFPPFEGKITENPDDGVPYNVTIPFLGVKSSDGAALVAADGGSTTLTDTTLANPGYLALASFSSAGPRSGDSALKPDVTAPGVSIASAGIGTGNGQAILSGTSMASPHTAGAAALVRQAHPSWAAVKYWKAALVNTADPSLVQGYAVRGAGAGFIQVQRAVDTQVVALGDNNTATLSFGYAEFRAQRYFKSHKVTLRNFGATPVKFVIGRAQVSGVPHSTRFVSAVTVPAHGSASVFVSIDVPGPSIGDVSAFHDAGGLITFTPVSGGNGGIALAVPYYFVPQVASNVHTSLSVPKLKSTGTTTAKSTNASGIIAGNADWYAYGVTDPQDATATVNDIRAIGMQTFPDDGVLAIGLATWKRWSNAAANEYDVYLDVNGDSTPDYVVVAADYGLVTAQVPNGQLGVFVFTLATGDGTINFLADAPMNSTSMALPLTFDQLCDPPSPCLSAGSPRIHYSAVAFAPGQTPDSTAGASFNAFTPSLSTGMFYSVAPNLSVSQVVTRNAAENVLTPATGFMIMTHDNLNATEIQLIPV